MKIIGYSKNHLPPTDGFPHAYMGTLSKNVRMVKDMLEVDLRPIVEGVVCDIAENEEVAESLKGTHPSGKDMYRQVDIKNDEGGLLLKCFVCWNKEHQGWHVLVEGAEERIFEDGEGDWI